MRLIPPKGETPEDRLRRFISRKRFFFFSAALLLRLNGQQANDYNQRN
jgi:hypothetical protein